MQANKKKGVLRLLIGTMLIAGTLTAGLFLLGNRTAGLFKLGAIDPSAQALELIRTHYVDPVSLDSLRNLPLDSILLKLDPHSVYLPPASLRIADEELAGHFAGIGIEFNRIRDTVTVAFLMAESPSIKAGLKTGDQLLAIDTRSLTDPRLSLDSIRMLARGPVGSTANLTIRRNGIPMKCSIRRSEIINPAVAASCLIDDTTGLIKLTRFSEKSYREIMIALEGLQQKGMRALILDLRGNGGGFLQEAVALADEFLSDDRLIVYTAGAHQKKRSYACKRPGLFETGSLTILIDEFSASASEVLAGALQDWCRAKIVGRRSFGKGLVQEQYALSNQGAIRLTVARYYTPLGRCIQRPYLGDRSAYLNEVLNNHDQPDALRNKTSRVFSNPCGDSLYAGGGIQPDLYVSAKNENHSTIGKTILQDPELIQWAYLLKNEYKSVVDTLKNSQALPTLISIDRIKRLIVEKATINGNELGSINASDWSAIAQRVYALVVRFQFGPNEFYRYLAAQDPFIQAARSISR